MQSPTVIAARWRRLVALLTLWWFPQAGADFSSSATAGELDPQRLRWHAVVLESKSLLVSIESRIVLSETSAEAVVWQPMPHASGPLRGPTNDELLLLEAEVNARVAVAHQRRTESVWFEPHSGQVLQQLRDEGGEEPEQKVYRFGKGNVYRLRRGPANAGEKDSIGRWSDLDESTYPHNLQDPTCELIVESTTLVYVIAAADPARHPLPWSICVFSRKRLYPITVAALREESIKVEYLEQNGRTSRKRKKRLEAQVIELGMSEEARRRVPADTFYFLGMRLPIVLHLDRESRAPLRVSGRVSDYGDAELELRELHLIDNVAR